MKKYLLSISMMISMSIAAQAQTEFGLKGGLSFPTYSYGDPDALSEAASIRSFYLAGYLEARIAPGVFIYPEVILQGKGAKVTKFETAAGHDVITQKANWLDFPVNFVTKVPITRESNFFAGAGPYLGIAIDGENTYLDGSTSGVIIYKDKDLRSYDYGINFLAGLTFWKRFSLHTSYRLGLANTTYDTNKWSKNIKNRIFSFGLGVSFAGLH